MTNWLIEQSLLQTILLITLLLTRKVTNRHLGALNAYRLWSLAPVTLIAGLISQLISPSLSEDVYQYTAMVRASVDSLIPEPTFFASNWLLAIWLTGVSFLFTAFILLHFEQKNRLQIRFSKNNSTRFYIPNNLTMGSSHGLTSPILFGWLKPTLVLPNDFATRFSVEQQRMIIKHEVTHFQRHDHLWNAVAIGLVVLFWFNPIAWISYRYFRQQQELACDHSVINKESLRNREQYALAMISASATFEAYFLTQLNYSEEYHMKERITLVGQHKTQKRLPILVAITIAISIIAGGQFAMASSPSNDKVYPVYRAAPVYPIDAAKNSIEGYVQLSFTIETNGTTSNVKVINAYPDETFNQVAIDALKKWQYKAPTKTLNNVNVQLDFVLGSDHATPPSKSKTEVIQVTKNT